ncbi:MAG: hypothetical protein Kow0099_17390 [Candidatus Abyssubacteria bacterium]
MQTIRTISLLILIIIFLLSWFTFAVSLVLLFIFLGRLLPYMKHNYYARWCELAPPGQANAYRVFRYIFNELDCEDRKIAEYKMKLRPVARASLYALAAGSGSAVLMHIIY